MLVVTILLYCNVSSSVTLQCCLDFTDKILRWRRSDARTLK